MLLSSILEIPWLGSIGDGKGSREGVTMRRWASCRWVMVAKVAIALAKRWLARIDVGRSGLMLLLVGLKEASDSRSGRMHEPKSVPANQSMAYARVTRLVAITCVSSPRSQQQVLQQQPCNTFSHCPTTHRQLGSEWVGSRGMVWKARREGTITYPPLSTIG